MRDRLATLFAKRDDPYAGVDLENASRFGGALWFVGAAFTIILLLAKGSGVFEAPQPQG